MIEGEGERGGRKTLGARRKQAGIRKNSASNKQARFPGLTQGDLGGIIH